MPSEEATALDPLRRKLGYRARLTAEDEAALLALPHATARFAAGRRVSPSVQSAPACCVILSGFAFRQKIVAKGARQIVALQMIGDIVDGPGNGRDGTGQPIEALTKLDVAFVTQDALSLLAEARPNIGFALWKDAQADLSIAREWIANIGRRDARSRIAHLLCEWAVRLQVADLGDETEYMLPMTQEQLADALGLTPPHVSRSLKALAEDGLISRNGRFIRIGDWKNLAKVGDFRWSYLRLRDDEPRPA